MTGVTREEDARWEATGNDTEEEEMEFASREKHRPKSTRRGLNPPLLGIGIVRSMRARCNRRPRRRLRVHRRRRSCYDVSARRR